MKTRGLGSEPIEETVYLSLGSNVGDRVANLRGALKGMHPPAVQVQRVSSFYETAPVGFRAQAWFVNCVVEVTTPLEPRTLLALLQEIERDYGRNVQTPKSPRTLDIDLLLYGTLVLHTSKLKLPHPRMKKRRFVLIPLCELVEEIVDPVTYLTVREMLARARDTSAVVWIGRG